METMIINQQNKVSYSKDLEKVITSVVNAAAKLRNVPANSEVSILLVDNSYIQELNLIYRDQDKDTDVLSFAMNELAEDEPDFDFSNELNVLGDIVISMEKAQFYYEAHHNHVGFPQSIRPFLFCRCHDNRHLLVPAKGLPL